MIVFKDNSSAASFKDMGYSNRLHISIKASFITDNIMDKDSTLGHQVICTKATIHTDKKMDSAYIMETMDQSIKAIGLKVRDMDKAYKYTPMDNNKK